MILEPKLCLNQIWASDKAKNHDFAKWAPLKWLWKAYFQSYRPSQPLYGKLRHRRFKWDPPSPNRRWSPIGRFFKNAQKTRNFYNKIAEKVLWRPKYGVSRFPKPLIWTVCVLRLKWDPPSPNLRWSPIDGFFKNWPKKVWTLKKKSCSTLNRYNSAVFSPR